MPESLRLSMKAPTRQWARLLTVSCSYSRYTKGYSGIVPLIVSWHDVTNQEISNSACSCTLRMIQSMQDSIFVLSELGHPMTPPIYIKKTMPTTMMALTTRTYEKSVLSYHNQHFHPNLQKNTNYGSCSSLRLGCVWKKWWAKPIIAISCNLTLELGNDDWLAIKFWVFPIRSPFYPYYTHPHYIFMLTAQSPWYVCIWYYLVMYYDMHNSEISSNWWCMYIYICMGIYKPCVLL